MSGGLTMDHTLLARSIWTAESKFLQQPPVDLYTSVVVTRSIPAGTCFGPCVLQSTFYETIAFIAQKSCDRRAKSCVFRVDPDAMRNSALVLSWLRLVQAARNAVEQNTEAFLKEGQLYVRTTRDIRPEEELLVWYDQELSHLLGFTDITKGSKEEFRCGRCDQVFRHEYPFVAHRFLCAQAKSDTWGRELYEHKHVEIKRQHRVTDFHNIARDLEHKKSSMNEDAEISPRKRRYEEILHPKWRKTVLLEKTNISNDDNITQLNKGYDQGGGGASSPEDKQKPERVTTDFVGRKSDDLSEAGKTTVTFTHGREEDTERRQNTGEGPCVHSGSYSAFSLVLSNNQREQKSAFCKPSKRTSLLEPQAHVSSAPAAPSRRLEEMSDAFPPRTALGYNNLMASSILSTDLQSVHSQVALGNTFHYAPEQWSRNVGAQLQSTPSLTILPPTFTSFGVSVQNWCAKCNLSFRMTSDLVFHMRSHHKKEFAAESQVRRRREENLTCPICHEYFRERHHLSRHMTSHN